MSLSCVAEYNYFVEATVSSFAEIYKDMRTFEADKSNILGYVIKHGIGLTERDAHKHYNRFRISLRERFQKQKDDPIVQKIGQNVFVWDDTRGEFVDGGACDALGSCEAAALSIALRARLVPTLIDMQHDFKFFIRHCVMNKCAHYSKIPECGYLSVKLSYKLSKKLRGRGHVLLIKLLEEARTLLHEMSLVLEWDTILDCSTAAQMRILFPQYSAKKRQEEKLMN